MKDTAPCELPTPKPEEAFTSFPKLPPELQVIIWNIAAHQPRNLPVFVKALHWKMPKTDVGPYKYVNDTTIPAILHTTKQSRYEGLKYFKLSFGVNQYLGEGIIVHIPARIYVNWISDMVIPIISAYDQGRLKEQFHLIGDAFLDAHRIALDMNIFSLLNEFIPPRDVEEQGRFALRELILYRLPASWHRSFPPGDLRWDGGLHFTLVNDQEASEDDLPVELVRVLFGGCAGSKGETSEGVSKSPTVKGMKLL